MPNHLSNTSGSSRLFDNQRLITITQLAEWLQIPIGTLRDWVFKRKIPHKRVGRLVRFQPSEVEHWINERK